MRVSDMNWNNKYTLVRGWGNILLIIFLIGMAFVGCGTSQASENQQSTGASDGAISQSLEQSLSTTEGALDGDDLNNADLEQINQEIGTDKGNPSSPAPVEPKDVNVDKKTVYHCTFSIACDTILDHLDDFDQAKTQVLPTDGIIFPATSVEFYEGESVFDVLLRTTKENKIHMEFVKTPLYNSNYIEGINNIYEFDCGELSGWMYRVNGWFPNYGCSRYVLKDGDQVEWVYTCDLGKDVGGDWNEQLDGNKE